MARWKRSWRTCTVRGTLDIFEHRKVNPRHQKSWQTHNMARRNSPLLCHTFGVQIVGVKEATKGGRSTPVLLPESFFFFRWAVLQSFPSRFSACVHNGSTQPAFCASVFDWGHKNFISVNVANEILIEKPLKIRVNHNDVDQFLNVVNVSRHNNSLSPTCILLKN